MSHEAGRSQPVSHQFAELGTLLVRQILGALQQIPPAMFQHRVETFARQFLDLGRPDLINRLVEPGHDVESIENVNPDILTSPVSVLSGFGA